MPTLRSQLDALAANFAKAIVAALQGASLHELVGADGGWGGGGRAARTVGSVATTAPAAPKASSRKPGRLPRRSAEEIQAELDKIVALVKKHKDGLRAEEIRSNLGMQSKEMPRILKEGISKKKLTSKGQKRATTYFAK
jgi:hypothetical protein